MWTFAALCSLTLFSDSVEYIMWGYVLKSYRDPVTGDKVSEMRSVSLLLVVFGGVGGLLSMPLVAAFGDRHGRRRVILLTLAISAIPPWLCVASNAVPGAARTWYVVVARSFAAFPVAGTLPAVSALAAELAPARWRASFVAVLFLGPALAGLFDSLVLQPVLEERGEAWQLERYNRLAIVGAIPLTLSFCVCWLWLPDSPRWLARCGQADAALALVGRLASSAGGEHAALLEALEARLAHEAQPPPRRGLLDPARRIVADGRRFALLLLAAALAAVPTAYVSKRVVRASLQAGGYPAGSAAAIAVASCLSLVLAPVLLDGLGRRWGLAALVALGAIATFFVRILDAQSSDPLLLMAFSLAASVALPSNLYVGAGLVLRVAELAPATGARETAVGLVAAAFFVITEVIVKTYMYNNDTVFFITATVFSLLAIAAVLVLPDARSSDLFDEADLQASSAQDRDEPQPRAKYGPGARDDEHDDEAGEAEPLLGAGTGTAPAVDPDAGAGSV
jgi:MFS family permease